MFSRSNSSATASQSPLNAVLSTPALKLEFALLVFVCIDCMRKALSATFEVDESSIGSSSQDGEGSVTSHARVLQNVTSGTVDDAPPPYSDASVESTTNLIDFDEPISTETRSLPESASQPRSNHQARAKRARKEYKQWDQAQSVQRLKAGLADPGIQGLRRAALTFFDAWRMSVLRRVGSTLNVLGDTVRKEKAKREASGIYNAATRSSVAGFEALQTRLLTLSEDQRDLLLQSALLLLLGLENYPAHSRTLLLYLTASLQLPSTALTTHELSTAKVLLTSTVPTGQTAIGSSSPPPEKSKASGLSWKMGLAAVGGAALIGVTGGLAAPLIAGGLGAVFGPVMGAFGLGGLASLLGGLIGNSVLVGALFGVYGAKRMSDVVEKLAKGIEDFELLPLKRASATEHVEIDPGKDSKQQESLQPQSIEIPSERLRVTICISGSLSTSRDVTEPWDVLADTSTVFALRYELTVLLDLGEKLESLVASSAFSAASYLVLRNTAFATLMAGLYWPMGLLQAATVVDNPFSVALARSEKAGVVLAQILMTKVHGERPVSLVGYGLGARVIWACCQELARQNAFGLISDVVLMGLPAPAVSKDGRETGAQLEWRKLHSVVSGRVVNCYSSRDWVLRFLYRLRTGLGGVAGMEAVYAPGVENEDVSDLVDSHASYASTSGSILQRIEFETDDDAVRNQSDVFNESKRCNEINDQRRAKCMDKAQVLEQDGKVEMVEESSGKIVLLDLESGALDERPQTKRGDLSRDLAHLTMEDARDPDPALKTYASAASPPPEAIASLPASHTQPLSGQERPPQVEDAAEASADDEAEGDMTVLAPEALPDPEPVTFGGRERGLEMIWEG